MLAGLGFEPFFAAAICLLANTSPVAFGSIGIPLVMLQTVTGLPMMSDFGRRGPHLRAARLDRAGVSDADHGRLESVESACSPRPLFAGITFAGDGVLRFQLHRPLPCRASRRHRCSGRPVSPAAGLETAESVAATPHRHTGGNVLLAWSPYLTLVVFVLLWGVERRQGRARTKARSIFRLARPA